MDTSQQQAIRAFLDECDMPKRTPLGLVTQLIVSDAGYTIVFDRNFAPSSAIDRRAVYKEYVDDLRYYLIQFGVDAPVEWTDDPDDL